MIFDRFVGDKFFTQQDEGDRTPETAYDVCSGAVLNLMDGFKAHTEHDGHIEEGLTAGQGVRVMESVPDKV